jgi:hypothetical protein
VSDDIVLSIEDLQQLQKTQKIRMMLVDSLTADGVSVPQSKVQAEMLMSALDGIDKQVMSKAKLNQQKESNNILKETIRITSSIVAKTSSIPDTALAHRSLELDPSIIYDNPVPGESDFHNEIDIEKFKN